MRRIAAAVLVTLALALMLALGASGKEALLPGVHVTMQFQATMTNTWSFPGQVIADDGCFVATESGSGSQSMHFGERQGRAYMEVVDAGSSIALQPSYKGERATPRKFGLGFGGAQVHRVGNEKTVYHKSVHWDSFCGPVPQEDFAPTEGCGGHRIPWDMTPIDDAGRLMMNVYTFAPSDLLLNCPFRGLTESYGPENADLPHNLQVHLPLSELRHMVHKKHGKLILRGHHRWHGEERQDNNFEVTATTDVDWKMILIRAYPPKVEPNKP